VAAAAGAVDILVEGAAEAEDGIDVPSFCEGGGGRGESGHGAGPREAAREELNGISETAEFVIGVDAREVERVSGGGEFRAEAEEVAFEPAAAEELVVDDPEFHGKSG
jgi:hypothetical protein